MVHTNPPSLPRLSPIGWSIDSSSDLHAAVFDIADGGSSGLTSEYNSGNSNEADAQKHTRSRQDSVLDPSLSTDPSRLPLWNDTEHLSLKSQHWPAVSHVRSSEDARSSMQHAANVAVDPTSAQTQRLERPRHTSLREQSIFDSDQARMQSQAQSKSGTISARRPLSRGLGAVPATASVERDATSTSTPVAPQLDVKVSRAASIFRLKRPFKGRSSSATASPNGAEAVSPQKSATGSESGYLEPNSSSSNATISSTMSGLGKTDKGPKKALALSNSRSSNTANDGDLSIQHNQRADGPSPGMPLPENGNRAKPPIPTLSLPEPEGDRSPDSAGGMLTPKSRSSSRSPRTSHSADGSRRKRDPPPMQSAPNSPLPPLPSATGSSHGASAYAQKSSLTPSSTYHLSSHDDEIENMIIGQQGDPVDEEEDMLRFPQRTLDGSRSDNNSPLTAGSRNSTDDASSSTSLQRIVRKTKSQTNMRLLRTRSILTNLRQPVTSSTRDLPQISPAPSSSNTSSSSRRDGAPWDSLTGSRLELADSSPETERISLSTSDDHQRGNASSPSLEEVHKALSPALDQNGKEKGAGLLLTNARKDSNSLSPGSANIGGQASSRLESSGGAGGLFGGSPTASNGRQRASSLLPWKQRANSQSNSDKSAFNTGAPATSAASQRSSGEKSIKIKAEGFKDDAAAFVKHVTATAPRTEIPAILAGSSDELHKKALQIFMQKFLFAGHPLDVSLRKLLMSLCLPKETQQIDRVMEAFARRYVECNENLFVSYDQPYMLAFSLMMLHTDTFNRNAKQKMSKADYVRNTSASGVATEVLEYLYDNLTFTQFIYVEDEDFLNQRRKIETESASSTLRSAFTSNSNTSKSRMDPYFIIASGQTHTLRPEMHIDEDNPFSATGTRARFDIEGLLRSFVNAPSIEIVTARKASLSSASAALGGYYATLPSVAKEEETIVTLRVAKVGCVSRKDDMLEDKKKSQSRKWRTWGMILSSTQLLFFRDLVWTSALDQRIAEQMREQPDKEGGVLITPQITYFKPDGVLALGDAVAVRDASYSKYKHVFRLLARQGDMQRQYLIQTASEEDMNDWIHKINFCGAFRSAGLRIRGLDAGSEQGSAPSTPATPFASAAEEQAKQNMSLDLINDPSLAPSSPSSPSSPSANGGIPMVGLLRRKLNARMREFTPVIEKVTARLEKCQADLDEKLRFARHIMIATPFLRSTRERLEAVAVPLAQEIRQLRLEVARCTCRRDILLLELEAGNRAAKASAPSTAFDERNQDGATSMAWQASTLPGTPQTLGVPSSYSTGTATPLDGSRSGSISVSRTSSMSKSRSSGSFNNDSSAVLPPPALSSKATADGGERASALSDLTPTLKSITLHGDARASQSSSTSPKSRSGTGATGASAEQHNTSPTKSTKKNKSRSSGFSFMGTGTQSSASAGTGIDGMGVAPAATANGKSSHRDHEQERWDRTKMGRDADKRISLVMLPDAQQWQALSAKMNLSTTETASATFTTNE